MITAVITSMGRRDHLELTLSFAMAVFDKVMVVDWSCPQGSGDYAAKEGASVFYKYGEKYYNGSRAKNAGAKLVTSQYVAFVDADSMCMPWLRDEIRQRVNPRRMILSCRNGDGTDVNDTVGFLVCSTDAFWNVGGFDESWIGWGNEDMHLRGKLFLDAKLEVVRLPSTGSLGAMAHGNAMRSENREEPIEKTAVVSFEKLCRWYAERGITDYPNTPALKDIVFNGARTA